MQFNIGVAAYRLGDYRRAADAFEVVARTPEMAALAHYNLGLVELERGKTEDARQWFARAQTETTDERLRSLASRQLDSLPPPPPQRNWVGYAAVGAGYDDNVALVSSADVLGVSGIEDAFGEVQLAISGPITTPWRFDAGLVYLDYQDLDEFDQLGVQGGARYRIDWGGWNNEIGLQLDYTTLNGEGFESRRMLLLQSTRDLSGDWRLRAQYRYSDLDGMNAFEGVTGDNQEFAVRGSRRARNWELGLEYRFETSDHEDENLSATRQQLVLDVRRDLAPNWAALGDVLLRSSDYDVAANGDEFLAEVALSIAWTASPTWRVLLRYAYTDNDADRAEFDYQRNRFGLVAEAVF